MKLFVALACALFIANTLLADPYSAAIQQAKRVSAQETAANQRLGESPTPVPPQNNPNTPADPALQATLQNIASLRNDFSTIGNAAAGASLTIVKQTLTNDLAIAAQGVKPQAASISRLADDLMTAISGKEKLRTPQQKLSQFTHAIFNSAHLTPAQQQTFFSGVQKILTDGGASADETANVVNDLKTIASETK